jgi:hypothetical protein
MIYLIEEILLSAAKYPLPNTTTQKCLVIKLLNISENVTFPSPETEYIP